MATTYLNVTVRINSQNKHFTKSSPPKTISRDKFNKEHWFHPGADSRLKFGRQVTFQKYKKIIYN